MTDLSPVMQGQQVADAINDIHTRLAAIESQPGTHHVSGLYDQAQAEIAALKAQVASEYEGRQMAEEIVGDYKARLGEVLAERDQARAELALCECENREKRAAIEKFLESEVMCDKALAVLRADLAKALAFTEQTGVECGKLRDQVDRVTAERDAWMNGRHIDTQTLLEAIDRAEKAKAELAGAKALLRDLCCVYEWHLGESGHSTQYTIPADSYTLWGKALAIVAAGGAVK